MVIFEEGTLFLGAPPPDLPINQPPASLEMSRILDSFSGSWTSQDPGIVARILDSYPGSWKRTSQTEKSLLDPSSAMPSGSSRNPGFIQAPGSCIQDHGSRILGPGYWIQHTDLDPGPRILDPGSWGGGTEYNRLRENVCFSEVHANINKSINNTQE